MTGLSVLLRNAIVIIYSRGVLQPYQASGGLGMEYVSCLHFDLSLAMAIHSSKSFEMPLLLSAFSNVLPQVICGQPIGRECDTQPVSNCRGARLGHACERLTRIRTQHSWKLWSRLNWSSRKHSTSHPKSKVDRTRALLTSPLR
jgi:hypothetical protein